MRINKFLALHTGLSRRSADEAIISGRVEINGEAAKPGDIVIETDRITLDGQAIDISHETVTIALHKPVGYVVSRNGQGSKTIYDLLPKQHHGLNPIGRLDKDSSGLLLLTNDGDLANRLTHPRYQKTKVYEVTLNKPLAPADRALIQDKGATLADGPSRLELKPLAESYKTWRVTIQEGRNRQIRRTFAALGYKVISLHRIQFGPHSLGNLKSGDISVII